MMAKPYLNNKSVWFLLAWFILYGQLVFGAEPAIQVLIFSGSNNHNWEQTTPELERILKRDPNFQVTVTLHPETLTAERLAECDVIVSNWNNFGKPDLIWPDSMRQAFTDFVSNGGGHVTVHAGGSSFYDWPQYHEIAAYWGKNTFHGPVHTFTVKPMVADHPIVQGIDSFETTDELWNQACFPSQSTILMTALSAKEKKGSGKEEPVLAVSRFGKGRCVNLMLGHDAAAMRNPGFETLLLRSTQFAARRGTNERHSLKRSDDSVAWVYDGNIVWQFNYGKDQTKPYFHPLSLADGTELTWKSPPDHPWHYGLWFSWKYINGVNYWEESRQTGKSEGITDWANVDIQTQCDGSARIMMELFYHEPDKPVVLKETRMMLLSAPDEFGSYSIDWESAFTAVADQVVLGRTPLPWENGGKPWGGYAGLSFRLREGIQDAQYVGTFGCQSPLSRGSFRYKDSAVEYSGTIDDKPFGIAVFDHPDNLNFPSPWYLNQDNAMNFFSPALLLYGPHTMSKGKQLKLNYRIIIHPGRWDSNELKQKHRHYTINSL